jgi:hypothetical protein
LEIAKSASISFIFRTADYSCHCKFAAVMSDLKSFLSVVVNDRILLMKFAPLIQNELNADLFLESGQHYDVQINISLTGPSQRVSIYLQSSSGASQNFEQASFACGSESSLRPLQILIQNNQPPATYTTSFDCNIELNTKYGYLVEGSSL